MSGKTPMYKKGQAEGAQKIALSGGKRDSLVVKCI